MILGVLYIVFSQPTGGVDPERLKMARLNASRAAAGGIVTLCRLAEADASSGDASVFVWPGTNAASMIQWKNTLTNYIDTKNLDRCFSAYDPQVSSWGRKTVYQTNAYYIYPVTTKSPANTVLMSTRNYRLPISGKGTALVATDKPFGANGAIVVTKGGGAQVITARQATNDVSSIGIVEGAPLN